MANAILSQAYGFKSFGRAVEGSLLDFENLDNYQHGIHDYFKFLKFGFGRASDHISMQIRRGRMSREQGIEIARMRDGKYPSTYLGKPLSQILERIDVSLTEFDQICDRFTNNLLFKTDKSGSFVRTIDKSLIKINYDNV
jgi:hypothetical protein